MQIYQEKSTKKKLNAYFRYIQYSTLKGMKWLLEVKNNKVFFRNRDYSQFVCLMKYDLVKKTNSVIITIVSFL